jgi:ubiquitin-conjugating enzyme E2 I
LLVVFSDEYPIRPPKVIFTPPLFHVNVYPEGNVCLSIINEGDGWKASISLKQILLGVQDLLDSPNPKSAANGPALQLYQKSKKEYDQKIREIAARSKPKE